jgi:hypothetical protein
MRSAKSMRHIRPKVLEKDMALIRVTKGRVVVVMEVEVVITRTSATRRSAIYLLLPTPTTMVMAIITTPMVAMAAMKAMVVMGIEVIML